jgi:hypothetical protein
MSREAATLAQVRAAFDRRNAMVSRCPKTRPLAICKQCRAGPSDSCGFELTASWNLIGDLAQILEVELPK